VDSWGGGFNLFFLCLFGGSRPQEGGLYLVVVAFVYSQDLLSHGGGVSPGAALPICNLQHTWMGHCLVGVEG